MASETIWLLVKKRLPGFLGGSGTKSHSTVLCKAGKHPIDPNWEECPRCKAEMLNPDIPIPDAPPVSSVNVDNIKGTVMTPRNPTRISSSNEDNNDSVRRATKVETISEISRAFEPNKKLVGVLVTFTWRREGQLFAIFEGKNFIGRGTVESEGGRDCDVLITDDETISCEQALILNRAGRYELFDQKSTGGTFLNDEFVENTGAILPDRSKIKTGATVWQFIKIESDTTVEDKTISHARHEEPVDSPEPTRSPSRVE